MTGGPDAERSESIQESIQIDLNRFKSIQIDSNRFESLQPGKNRFGSISNRSNQSDRSDRFSKGFALIHIMKSLFRGRFRVLSTTTWGFRASLGQRVPTPGSIFTLILLGVTLISNIKTKTLPHTHAWSQKLGSNRSKLNRFGFWETGSDRYLQRENRSKSIRTSRIGSNRF